LPVAGITVVIFGFTVAGISVVITGLTVAGISVVITGLTVAVTVVVITLDPAGQGRRTSPGGAQRAAIAVRSGHRRGSSWLSGCISRLRRWCISRLRRWCISRLRP